MAGLVLNRTANLAVSFCRKADKVCFPFNLNFILEKYECSAGQSQRSGKNYIKPFKKLFRPKNFLVISFVFGLFLAAVSPAEAGIFSLIKNIFKSDVQVQTASVFNTQNMPLLDAPTNIDPLAGIGGGEINIVQNNALLAVTGPMGSIADIDADAKNNSRISVYIVREGDNLSGIAKMFGVSVNTIRWANNLTTSTVIRPGQTFMILPIDSIRHTVVKGETLSGIVKKYGGDLEETLAFNGWAAGYKPEVETVVIIPNGEGEPLINSGTIRGSGGPSYAGYYIRPVNGGRISQGLHGLNAKDFSTYCEAPVVVSARGTVIVSRSSGWNGGYGLYVVIAHPNGTQTLYSHMSSIVVSAGWNVVQGQIIGYVGSTGQSTGCHVHFEVRGAAFPNI